MTLRPEPELLLDLRVRALPLLQPELLEQRVLGFAREDDVPGALIPAVYFDYLRRKHPGELSRVFDHNRHDILSLAALTGRVAAAAARAPDADLSAEDLAGLGRLWERRDADRGEACYRLALRLGLEGPGRERLLARLALGEKRRARFAEARSLWEEIVRVQRTFDPRPWEEMAKIDEHRHRNLASARAVVAEALVRARGAGAAVAVLEALSYRLERLTRRLERLQGSQGYPEGRGVAGKVTTCSTCASARTRVPVGKMDEDGCEECTRCPEGSRMQ